MTHRLSIRTITDAQLAVNRIGSILEATGQAAEIHLRLKVFEAVVWFPHLQRQVNGTDSRGMSGMCRDIKVMTWCCAGRCLIQLERQGHAITLITADDEKPWGREMAHVAPNMGPMGLQHIDAEYLEALKLLYHATRYGSEIVLAPDEAVSIG